VVLHVEEIHHAPHGLRDFIRQYAMIVISILTALAAETLFVDWHDRQRAAESRVRIEAELQRNATDLKTCIAQDKKNIASFNGVFKLLAALEKAGDPPPAKLRELLTPEALNVSICVNTWLRDAWDSAIADQSAGHLDPADLRRYTQIYTDARDNAALSQSLLGSNWTTQMAEAIWDRQIDKPNVRGIAVFLAQLLITMTNINGAQQNLLSEIEAPARRR